MCYAPDAASLVRIAAHAVNELARQAIAGIRQLLEDRTHGNKQAQSFSRGAKRDPGFATRTVDSGFWPMGREILFDTDFALNWNSHPTG